MSTDVIKVLPKTFYDFTSTSGTYVIKRALDVTASSTGSLLVRVHDHTVSAGSVQVVVKIAAPSDDDPSIDFIGGAVATASITGNTPAAPQLLKEDLDPTFGGFLWIEVVGTSGAGTATISCDLAMKV